MITYHNIGHNGRFGNQIFQFAALFGIANKLGYNFCIPRNNLNGIAQMTSDGKPFVSRFELMDCFNIDDRFIDDPYNISSHKSEAHFHFDESMMNISDFTNINGYFQTDKYFRHCREELLDTLTFKDEILEAARKQLPQTDKELVSIHIRRGDYAIPNPYHPVVSENYIDNAKKYFDEEKSHFVIFSDDIEWCKNIWKGENYSFVNSGSHFVDFCAMSLCKHNIIANSSFSWWASYISREVDKKIIAPTKWFGPGYAHYITEDIYTEKMIRVSESDTKNISVLTICTGNYTIFFKEFYETCEKYFLPGHSKKYFVFTDGDIEIHENVIRVEQQKLGWPFDTMLRFKMFDHISEHIDGDFVYFFNANMRFEDYVTEEVFPDESHDWLMGVIHPGYYNKPCLHYPYERRPISNFCINGNAGETYYQGCFNGGRRAEFMEMSKILDKKIDEDMMNGIIPLWHDESALNWYYHTRNPKKLDSSYAYPESWNIPFKKKIVQIDKNNYGGHHILRN